MLWKENTYNVPILYKIDVIIKCFVVHVTALLNFHTFEYVTDSPE